MELLFVAAIIILALLFILIAWCYIKNTRLLKQESEKIKVGRDLRDRKIWLVCSCIWIIIAGSTVYFDTEEIHDIKSGIADRADRSPYQTVEEYREKRLKIPVTHRKFYSLLGVLWTFSGILCVVDLTKFKYSYVTENGVYSPGSFIAAKDLSYVIDGDTLEFFRGKRNTPKKLAIIEDKEHLERMLSDNYSFISTEQV